MNELQFDVNCPHCKRSLMDPYRMIHNKPSIRVNISSGDKSGVIRLCSIYGCYDYLTDVKLKNGDLVEFTCPHCKEILNSQEKCSECEAPMVNFKLSIGGMVCICSRSGCKNHSVGFVDLSSALNSFYHQYKYGDQ